MPQPKKIRSLKPNVSREQAIGHFSDGVLNRAASLAGGVSVRSPNSISRTAPSGSRSRAAAGSKAGSLPWMRFEEAGFIWISVTPGRERPGHGRNPECPSIFRRRLWTAGADHRQGSPHCLCAGFLQTPRLTDRSRGPPRRLLRPLLGVLSRSKPSGASGGSGSGPQEAGGRQGAAHDRRMAQVGGRSCGGPTPRIQSTFV